MEPNSTGCARIYYCTRTETLPRALKLSSIKAACRVVAKSCELRTAMSMVRMWQNQDNVDKLRDAYVILSDVYNWFTEGFKTRDLQEAKELLDAL